ALVGSPRLDGDVAIGQNVTAADVEARAGEVAYEGRAVAFGRQNRLLAARLQSLAALVRLRLRVAEGSARSGLEEHVRASDETDAVAVLTAQIRREREAVDYLLIALRGLPYGVAHLVELLLKLCVLLVLLRHQ